MNLYTIGFTKKSAETFFGLLQKSGAGTLVDVRLNNVSQLAGFAKRDDLAYFLRQICGMTYAHRLDLAPTQPMLDDYKKHNTSWPEYEDRFLGLMKVRQIETHVPRELLDNLFCCAVRISHTTATVVWSRNTLRSTGATSISSISSGKHSGGEH